MCKPSGRPLGLEDGHAVEREEARPSPGHQCANVVLVIIPIFGFCYDSYVSFYTFVIAMVLMAYVYIIVMILMSILILT